MHQISHSDGRKHIKAASFSLHQYFKLKLNVVLSPVVHLGSQLNKAGCVRCLSVFLCCWCL